MKIIRLLFFLLLFVIGGLGYYLYNGIYSNQKLDSLEISIPRGFGFSQVNGLLSRAGIVKDSRLFYHYAKWTDSMDKIQAGFYKFPQEASLNDILSILKEGSKHFIKVTIPEGKNLFEIAQILENEKVIESAARFIKLCLEKPDPSLGLPEQAISVEGYLYPETYHFAPGSSFREVVYNMVLTFNEKTKALDKNAFGLNWHQIITLASIVEKETGVAKERAQIAAVFHNRLQKGMRLQSDPTTIYGIFERFDGNLRKKDLLEMTPFNTYKIKSLPPGPIASPGIEAIKAVLNPDDNQYLYFVARGDGTHIFSKTYKEHRKAVDYFQKKIR